MKFEVAMPLEPAQDVAELSALFSPGQLLNAINSATQCNVMRPRSAKLWFIRTFGDTAHLLANPLICC